MRRVLRIWGVIVGLGCIPLRGEFTFVTPDRRVTLSGPDGKVLQETAVWAVRGIRALEREAGQRIPFQENVPLFIRFLPEQESTVLLELFRGSQLWQELLTPASEVPDAMGLADEFTRALLHRLLWQANPGSRKPAPDGLVYAFSHVLLDGMSPHLLRLGLAQWREGRLGSPAVLLEPSRPRPPGGIPLTARAHFLLAQRFWFSLHSDAGEALRGLALSSAGETGDWLRAHREGRDLRDLHIAWDLWLSQRDRSAIADLADAVRAEERLEQLLQWLPAEFGLGGEGVPRYTRLRLPDVEAHLREPWVEPMLQAWTLRVQLLRFRQEPKLLRRMDLYVEAARFLLEANRQTGRRREEALAAFQRVYEEAESLRPVTGPSPAP